MAHTSGALAGAVLASAAAAGACVGSWHPLAAFAARGGPLPSGLTFAVEGPAPLSAALHRLTAALGGRALDLQAADKPRYHLAAVLASNYSVVLAALATELLGDIGIAPPDALAALLPLLETTLVNLRAQGLPGALTGPLVRGDAGTISRHLAIMADQPALLAAYQALAVAALPLLSPAAATRVATVLTPPTAAAVSQ